jgi:CO/xanthine dehydrogenase FAD-binding subunit
MDATEENFRQAAAVEFADAAGRAGNAFKIGLGQRTIVAVLRDLRGEERRA